MATGNSKIILGLPSLPNDQLTSSAYNESTLIYRAINNLAQGVSLYAGVDSVEQADWDQYPPSVTVLSGNLTRLYPVAAVAITAGQIINLYSDAGVMKARLASATSATTMAHGVANTACGIGERFEMQWLRCYCLTIGGMTAGTLYWLSTVGGAIQNLPPVAAGTIAQPIGLAFASSELLMDIPLSYKQN